MDYNKRILEVRKIYRGIDFLHDSKHGASQTYSGKPEYFLHKNLSYLYLISAKSSESALDGGRNGENQNCR